jgi:hypothetical protein
MDDNGIDRVNDLCNRIAAVLTPADNTDDVLNALVCIYTGEVSRIDCPDCRKQAMRALKRSIPDMLVNANLGAAERIGSARAPMHTHH